MNALTRVSVLVALAALLSAGCKKPQPSDEFAQASNDFASIYGQKLDEAYVDPRMDDILAQLQKVPADSSDAEAARALISRIDENRKRVQAEAAARADATAKILRNEAVAFNPTPAETQTPTEQPAAADAPRDAGTGVPKEPKYGMAQAEFDKHFGDCFEAGPDIFVGGAKSGASQSRVLRNFNRCKDKLPGFDQKYVLFQDGAVIQIMNKSDIQVVTVRPDGGTVEGGR